MLRTVLALVFLAAATPAFAQQACPLRMGGILSLTGSMGQVGKNIADTAVMAVEHVNQAGGIHGCQLEFLLRDDQNQPSVGVDAAKNLVEVSGVPALIGAISSAVTLPVLTSVAAPSKVTQVTCCSTSPTFTQLAAEGKTGGYWFRPIPTLVVQSAATAKIALDRGWKKVAVMYVNTDFGVTLDREFRTALTKLGGEVTVSVPFNENQPSYRAEVAKGLAAQSDAMFLVGFPQDSATVAREWISNGGTQNFLLNNALRSDDFLKNVGPRFLNTAWGFDYAPAEGASVDAFVAAFKAKFGREPNGPGLHNVYDAVVLTALAMASAQPVNGTSIRDNIRKVMDPAGTVVNPGPDGVKKALELIKAGQKVRYVGAVGPVQFDANGDISGPALIWRVNNGAFERVNVLGVEEMQGLFRRIQG